jgi:hypothetical protein
VLDVDDTAPTITSANSTSVAENASLAWSLTANESVTWAIRTVGQNGASVDHDKFEISGSTLRWAANGTKNYEAPDDTGTNNTYVVVVRATDLLGNTADQTFTTTVTNVTEDTTPDAFTFVDETSGALSTVYTSNAITVAGIDGATAVTVSGGEYRKNGGSWVSAPGTVVAGDSVDVRLTTSGSYSTAVNCTLTIGGVSDTYTVTTGSGSGSIHLRFDFSSSDYQAWAA